MNLFERVSSEFGQIQTTDFWNLYLAELAKYRKLKNDKLETCTVEQFQREQGEILCLKFIAGLPDRILAELAKNTQEQDGTR